jgi:hypothetical protein
MQLDKNLYRQAYEEYREWNAAEAAERARSAGRLSPAEAWRRYVDLVEFCWRLAPEPGAHQRREKAAALDRYYSAVQRLEERRQTR